MIARLLISKSPGAVALEIEKILKQAEIKNPHPDLLYFPFSSKLGIAEARKIKEHFSLKPYSAKGRVVILEDASALTPEAQNALLKTLEEPPTEAILILGAPSDSKLLPTILSRCQVIRVQGTADRVENNENEYEKDIEKLLKSDIEERFEYIEKCKERQEFFQSLVTYFHQHLASHTRSGNLNFLKELLQAEQWATQNVNIRAILEYLMLEMPKQK